MGLWMESKKDYGFHHWDCSCNEPFYRKLQMPPGSKLHSPFEAERRSIMPISQKYSIKQILDEIKSHDLGRQRRTSFEYIVFKGMNDTPKACQRTCTGF